MTVHAAGQSPSPAGTTDQGCHGDSPDRARRLVLLAGPRSLCAGVERAIDTVERLLASRAACSGPVYVRKQMVHNTHVVAGLAVRGAASVDELAEIPAVGVQLQHGQVPRALAMRCGCSRSVSDTRSAPCCPAGLYRRPDYESAFRACQDTLDSAQCGQSRSTGYAGYRRRAERDITGKRDALIRLRCWRTGRAGGLNGLNRTNRSALRHAAEESLWL